MGIFDVDVTVKVTRTEAAKLGATRFRTLKMCKNGHIAERFTCSGACVECVKQANKATRVRKKRAKYDRKFKDHMGL